jgi:hypothetical protein
MRALLLCALVGCGGGEAPVVHQPVVPPIFDHAIVLGQRVGPISLGMTTAQLVAAVPGAAKHEYGGTRVGYTSTELHLHAVVEADQVVFVASDDPAYATADGLHIGGAGSDVANRPGATSKRSHGTQSYCVSSTLITVATEASPACAVGAICDLAVGGC